MTHCCPWKIISRCHVEDLKHVKVRVEGKWIKSDFGRSLGPGLARHL